MRKFNANVEQRKESQITALFRHLLIPILKLPPLPVAYSERTIGQFFIY